MEKNKKKIITVIILFIAIIGASISRSYFTKGKLSQRQGNGKIPVKVMTIKLETIQKAIDYVGDIKAQEEVIVYPRVSGKVVQKLKEEGAQVAKGEIIAYLDRDEVGLTFEKVPVDVPLTGVIGRVYVDIGSSVTAQTPIALLVNMDTVKIDLEVPEKYLPRLAIGQTAEVAIDAYPDEVFSGSITTISPVLTLETRAAPVEVTIENAKHKLQSGMFAKVRLILEKLENVPLILKEAVIGKAPNQYTYVVIDNKAHLQNLTLGIRQGSYYEVQEGLQQGDRVVIMGQQRLFEGAPVIAEE